MTNLDAYFSRIDFSGETTATLTTLDTLHQCHAASIPFENINVLLNKGINLDPTAIDKKLISDGRGGYCFEQNNLFMRVLQTLGFDVEPLMARAVWNSSTDTPSPRTHMILRIKIDTVDYLADVGFGGLVLANPLKFDISKPQITNHETFRLITRPHGYLLQALINNSWQTIYDISNEPQKSIDLEVANWYTSKHPDSKFRHNLMAARTTKSTRYTLLNNRLSIRKKGQQPIKQLLNAGQLKKSLTKDFLLPVTNNWQPMIEKIAQKQ